MHRRGPDRLPRKPVVATVQLAALMNEQLRDPRTGRPSRSKWAKGVLAAGLQDFLHAHMRLLYLLATGEPHEAAALASAVTRTGEYFGAYLDDKPTSGVPRVTIFNVAPGVPSAEVPPEQGQRPLSRAEEGYVEVREEDAAP